MAFEYGCFISYAHPEGSMMKKFIEDLVLSLKSELDPYMRDQVYFDEERLKPGYRPDPALGQALCASACWILVYVPQYRKRDYCLREYSAMQVLQAQRERELGRKLDRCRSMIVPILVRGSRKEFPDALDAKCLEFDHLTLANATISDSQEAMTKLRDLAGEIGEIHELGEELSHDCESFDLPPANGDFRSLRRRFPGDPPPTHEGGE